jgi:hypothetical protein
VFDFFNIVLTFHAIYLNFIKEKVMLYKGMTLADVLWESQLLYFVVVTAINTGT